MREVVCRVRDGIGLALLVVGFLVMTDECVVEAVTACAETIDEVQGGGGSGEAPAIRTTPTPGR